MPITMKRAMEIVLELADGNKIGDVCQDIDIQMQAEEQEGSICKISRLLDTVDEFCQMGLNSRDPKHWEAALRDIMQYVRE